MERIAVDIFSNTFLSPEYCTMISAIKKIVTIVSARIGASCPQPLSLQLIVARLESSGDLL